MDKRYRHYTHHPLALLVKQVLGRRALYSEAAGSSAKPSRRLTWSAHWYPRDNLETIRRFLVSHQSDLRFYGCKVKQTSNYLRIYIPLSCFK